MKRQSAGGTIAVTTLVAGSLDLLWAMLLTTLFGREIPNMLRYVASGPFPAAQDMGASGAAIGVAVHFLLMTAMAGIFVLAAQSRPQLLARPIVAGILYGLLTYVLMNLLVVPVRFGTPLPPKAISVATQLFAHIVLVGIPTALITARMLRHRPAHSPAQR